MADESEKFTDAEIAEMLELLRPVEKIAGMLELLKPMSKEPRQSDAARSAVDKDWRRKTAETFSEGENPESYLAMMTRRALNPPSLPKLDPLSPNVVIAAESHPGFSPDLTSWNLTIDSNGILHQHIHSAVAEKDRMWELREEHADVGSKEVAQLVVLAIELGFPNFQYTSMCAIDMGSCRISIRINEQIETVVDRCCPSFTPESEERFYHLWREITQHAPFSKR